MVTNLVISRSIVAVIVMIAPIVTTIVIRKMGSDADDIVLAG